jgi:hypothetical protein
MNSTDSQNQRDALNGERADTEKGAVGNGSPFFLWIAASWPKGGTGIPVLVRVLDEQSDVPIARKPTALVSDPETGQPAFYPKVAT